MAINANEDTEFNDALRKHGILPPRPVTPPSPSPPASPDLDDLLDDFSDSELRELAQDSKDDDAERRIEAFRRMKLAQERSEQRKARFGRVYPIARDDYTREVTDASKIDEEDDDEHLGTGVVCLLYKDGIPRSERTFGHIRTLAQRHPRTKFVSIVGDKCIPNLPDSRVPMIISYKAGDICNQLVAWGADKDRTLEELEAMLVLAGAIHAPYHPPAHKKDEEDSSEEDEDADFGPRRTDPSDRMRSAGTGVNSQTGRNIRNARKKEDDEDNDFEFDL